MEVKISPVALAKESLQHFLTSGKIMPLPDTAVPPELTRPAGVFVSLKKRGQLRGCIGTILPTQATAAQEIVRNAVSAATADPRFPKVTAAELAELDVSVDILGAPERVAGMEALDPVKYGVIVKQGHRSGVLLPDLEGVDNAAMQVTIACNKAGIDPADRFELFRFQVVRHR